jgi:hypothetical protein
LGEDIHPGGICFTWSTTPNNNFTHQRPHRHTRNNT